MDFMFFFNSILLGVGLSMDAFSVSLGNGLSDPCMKKTRVFTMAGVFGFFQLLMPIIGWICVHTIVQYFSQVQKLIPWIALFLLGFIGGKMIFEGTKNKCECDPAKPTVGIAGLIVQAIATSIDALSVGFTISEYSWVEALICCTLIGLVTFFICVGGILIGKRFGVRLAGKAGILGGGILVLIGLEIFITGILP